MRSADGPGGVSRERSLRRPTRSWILRCNRYGIRPGSAFLTAITLKADRDEMVSALLVGYPSLFAGEETDIRLAAYRIIWLNEIHH